MSSEEFDNIIPRHSVIEYKDKKYLVKFITCSSDLYGEYWIVATDDFSNPEPYELLDSDLQVLPDECQLISVT